jgi:alkylation response protein AidB-like acyl-CoA dehydrogenase
MGLSGSDIAQQKKQAEELLFSGKETLGFAKSLFFGQFNAELVFPYPRLNATEKTAVDKAVAEVAQYCQDHIDAAAIDRNADIPHDNILGLAQLGVLGMTAPKEVGGRGFSQTAYCKIMEVIGGHCSSTAVFVNAHHSIGIRALLLFGSEAQKQRWLPGLVNGTQLAAFALTEEQAGSDAGNVQTLAVPSADGKSWILNGTKRYITNGGIAQVLTVMARTAVAGTKETKVTAFLVTPDMPGFRVVEARMPKCGIRGTATAKLAFQDMVVPSDNVLGEVGKGLRIALTVLDFGRTTFGASCTGAAKRCLQLAVDHAKKRVQFKQTLSEFELVKKKIAWMAAHTFAMEALTTQCAAYIDSGAEDYMLETAMLKVWSTEALWQMVNDTLQIYGGAGYFTDLPLERMMRDARINQIGEGANDVMRSFIAVVGMRGVGESLKDVLSALKSPLANVGTLLEFGRSQLAARFSAPTVPVQNPALREAAANLAARVRDFGKSIVDVLRHIRGLAMQNGDSGNDEETRLIGEVMKRQYLHERLADAACDLYASSCTLSRLDELMTPSNGHASLTQEAADIVAGRYFLQIANRRIRQNLAALWDNEDEFTTQAADAALMR